MNEPLIGTIFGLVITTLTFLTRSILGAKARKVAEQAIKFSEILMPYVSEAEKFVSYSGAEKKAYVMTKANQFALKYKIAFNEDEVSRKIEELVNLTKQVNISNKEVSEENNKTTTKDSWL